MKELDPWRLDLDGTTLIEASAGTGKTYTLTTFYLRLLVEEDLLPSEILVVTYTQAATAELRERVRERIREAIAAGEASDSEAQAFDPKLRWLGLAARDAAQAAGGPDPLRRALQEFDEAAIFTIHGFCQRILQRHAFESGVAFDAELIEASDLLQETLVRDLWARGLAEEETDFVEWLLEGRGRRWQFEPGALKRNLLDQLGADEEMPVLPDGAATPQHDSDWETLRAQRVKDRVRWALAWQVSRARVVPWLLDGDDLNGNQYRRAQLEAVWIPELDAWSEALAKDQRGDRSACFELPKWWEKLTPTGLAKGVKKKHAPLEDSVFEAFEAVLSSSVNLEAAFSARALAMRRRFVNQARAEARRRREERHLLVFDDLLCELRTALRPPQGTRLVELLRREYRFALIDEFQDTDPVQYEIFRRVWHREGQHEGEAARGGLVLIGDPKQAIYSFRGADLFTYLSARSDAAGSTYGLHTNWRSDPGLIRVVNALFGTPEQAFGFHEIGFHPVAPRPKAVSGLCARERSRAGLRVLLVDRESAGIQTGARLEKEKSRPTELPLRFGRTELMKAFARDVADLLDSDVTIGDRSVAPSDVAVLCRTQRELARARRALEALGIPCVDRGETDVFESREAWELLCVLRAMLRSGNPDRLRSALATGALGWDAAALVTLTDDSSQLGEISERYAEYARIWSQSGFMRALETWRRQEGVTPRLLALVDGDRRLTNWLHLAELLQSLQTSLSDRSPSRSSLADWLERAIADPEIRSVFGSEASLLRLERDDQAVSLVTLHRSKGLQYEIVYLPSLWEDASPRGPSDDSARSDQGRNPPIRCHDPDAGRRVLDLGGPCYAEHVARQKEEVLSEQLRLLYVGLTRAKRQCVVVWGAIGRGHYASTPIAWLLHAPEWQREGKERSTSEKEIRGWDDERWRRAWTALGEAAGEGALSLHAADWSPRERWQAPVADKPVLGFDRIPRSLPRARITTSFTGLVRGARRATEIAIGPAAVGRDLDIDIDIERVALSDSIGSSHLAAEMDAFPRGAEAGTLLHDVLEQVDFGAWREAAVRELAIRAL
ncbi:MAG: UvrD-helicase domain-containing protein, partial [Myxococcota bacterium]